MEWPIKVMKRVGKVVNHLDLHAFISLQPVLHVFSCYNSMDGLVQFTPSRFLVDKAQGVIVHRLLDNKTGCSQKSERVPGSMEGSGPQQNS